MKTPDQIFSRIATTLAMGSFFIGSSAFANVNEDTYATTQEGWDTPHAFISMQDTTSSPAVSDTNQIYSARPEMPNGWGVFFFGDFLYWKAHEGGLSYALPSLNNTASPPSAQNDPNKGVDGKVARITPGYHAGFRIGMAVNLPRDEWALNFSWTSYNNHQDASLHPSSPKVVFPFWLNPNYSPLAQEAQAHWNLRFDTIDLTLGREFFTGKFLSFKPFIGFQAAWIEQMLKVNYKDVIFSDSSPMASILSKNRNNSQGYGLTAGLDTRWELKWGFSIEANVAASLLWTNFDINQIEKNSDYTTRTHLKDSLQLVTAMADLFAGLSWERWFCSNKWYVELHAGWEEQIWMKENQLNRFPSQINEVTKNMQGDLTFSGWTIGAKIGF